MNSDGGHVTPAPIVCQRQKVTAMSQESTPYERTFISAGCEVPVDTPHANLLAHYEALRAATADSVHE